MNQKKCLRLYMTNIHGMVGKWSINVLFFKSRENKAINIRMQENKCAFKGSDSKSIRRLKMDSIMAILMMKMRIG